MQDSFDVTTLIFLVLAVFVIWRLRSVLGQKTGHEQPPFDPLARRDQQARPSGNGPGQDNVVRLPGAQPTPTPPADRWKGFAEPGSPIAAGLDEIARAEPSFDAGTFLEGAKAAYEAIVMNEDGEVLERRTFRHDQYFAARRWARRMRRTYGGDVLDHAPSARR